MPARSNDPDDVESQRSVNGVGSTLPPHGDESQTAGEKKKKRDKGKNSRVARMGSVLSFLVLGILGIVALATKDVNVENFVENEFDNWTFTHTVADLFILGVVRDLMTFATSFPSLCPTAGKAKLVIGGLDVLVALFVCCYAVLKLALIVGIGQVSSLGLEPHLMTAFFVSSLCFGLLGLILATMAAKGLHAHKDEGYDTLAETNPAEDEYEYDKHGNRTVKPPKRTKPAGATFKRLIEMAKYEHRLLLVGSVALIAAASSQLATPWFFGHIIQAIAAPMINPDATGTDTTLRKYVLILLAIFAVSSAFSLARSWCFTLAGERFVARMRTKVFNSMMIQEVAYFDGQRTGDLTSRLSSDTQVLQNAATVNISMFLRYLVQIFGSLAMLFSLSWLLTLVMLSVVPIVAFGIVYYGGFVKTKRKEYQTKLGEANSTAEESLSNIRTVRSFSRERAVQQQYERSINKAFQRGAVLAKASGFFMGIVGFIPQAALVLVIWFGGSMVLHGQMTLGELTSFVFYTMTVAMAFAFLANLFTDLMNALGAAERIFEVLDRHPTIPVAGGRTLPEIKDSGCVELKNVTFAYPERKQNIVLSSLDLTVHKGKVTALVGPSGGGKSTVVGLVERFYDVANGVVTFDGVDIRELDMRWYRRRVALVSQEPVLFAATIRENICFGLQQSYEQPVPANDPTSVLTDFELKPEYTVSQEAIERAAKLANAHDFIMSFEQGYDTVVGERGVRLSGGQKQRVAIARALLLDPSVLLLDEATSALDAESEAVVQAALDNAMQGRTVLVIAHRLSTVRNADQVAVLQGGKIVELGTHDTLMAKSGVYKKLVERQLRAGATETQALSSAKQ